MLDIDRLNSVMNGENNVRQGGRTTAMIVSMLAQVDFVGKSMSFYMFCGSSRYAEQVKHLTITIAREMGFSPVYSDRRFMLRVFPEHEQYLIDIFFVGGECAELQQKLRGRGHNGCLKFYDTHFFEIEKQ